MLILEHLLFCFDPSAYGQVARLNAGADTLVELPELLNASTLITGGVLLSD
jgi:hypothetical protein